MLFGGFVLFFFLPGFDHSLVCSRELLSDPPSFVRVTESSSGSVEIMDEKETIG